MNTASNVPKIDSLLIIIKIFSQDDTFIKEDKLIEMPSENR